MHEANDSIYLALGGSLQPTLRLCGWDLITAASIHAHSTLPAPNPNTSFDFMTTACLAPTNPAMPAFLCV